MVAVFDVLWFFASGIPLLKGAYPFLFSQVGAGSSAKVNKGF